MAKLEWKTEKRKVKDLVPHVSNPRQLSKASHAQLLRSFKKFNYAELVAVNADNTILAGHQRVAIMQELGWGEKEIEVRVANQQINDKDAKEYLIRSNKNVGEFDFDILANEFELDDLIDWGFEKSEFDLGDWDSDLSDGSDEPPPEPDSEIIKLQVPLGKRTEILPIIKAALASYNVSIL